MLLTALFKRKADSLENIISIRISPSYYQITQMDEPICTEGHLDITVLNDDGSSYNKSIRINRIHMEEDAGKLVHDDTGRPLSYVDLKQSWLLFDRMRKRA